MMTRGPCAGMKRSRNVIVVDYNSRNLSVAVTPLGHFACNFCYKIHKTIYPRVIVIFSGNIVPGPMTKINP